MAERPVDIELIRQLAELLDKSSLSEIEVEDEGTRIRVARTVVAAPAPTATHQMVPTPVTSPVAAPAPAEVGASTPADTGDAIRSPMVGTAYLSAEPGAKPFVAPGQRVAAGDTLVIIEAMKVMNPIVATAAGTVREVLVANGQPVEFDQPLVVLD